VRVDGKEVISRNENGNTIKSPEATDEDLVNYTKFAINLLYNRDFNVDVSTVPHNSFATEQGGFVMEGYELFETFTFSDKRHIDSYTRFTVSNSLSIIATDRNEIPFWYENPMDLFTALEHEFGHEKVNFFHTINLNTPLYRGGERRIEFVRDNYVSLLQTPKSVKITSCKPRGEKATPSIIIDAIRKFSNEVNTILRYEWTSPIYEHSTERYKRHSVRYYDFNLFNLQNWQNAIPVYNSYFE
jgi:hypothetical protein